MASGHGIAGMALLSAYGDEEDEDEELEEEAAQKVGDGGGAEAGKDAGVKGPAPSEAAEQDAARQGPSGASGREAGGESVDLGGGARGSAREADAAAQGASLGAGEPSSGGGDAQLDAQPVSLFPAATGALGILDYGHDAADDDEEEEGPAGTAAVKGDGAAQGKAHVLTPPGPGGGKLSATPPNATPRSGGRLPTPPPAEGRAGDGRGAGAAVNGVHAAEDRTGGAREEGVGRDTGPSGREGARAGEEDAAVLDFLGPPVAEPCPEELQAKFVMHHARKQRGVSYNETIRNSMPYRNPYLMQQVVELQEIKQHGTLFAKDVFDPTGYPASDFYDTLLVEQRREAERREAERKARGAHAQVEFHRGGVLVQQATGGLVSKPVVQVIAGPRPPASAAGSVAGAPVVQKRSKWDKGGPAVPLQTTPPGSALPAVPSLLGASALAQAAMRGQPMPAAVVPLGAAAGAAVPVGSQLGGMAGQSSGIGRGAHLAAAAVRAAAASAAAISAAAAAASMGTTVAPQGTALRKDDDKALQRKTGR